VIAERRTVAAGGAPAEDARTRVSGCQTRWDQVYNKAKKESNSPMLLERQTKQQIRRSTRRSFGGTPAWAAVALHMRRARRGGSDWRGAQAHLF
jgi:IS5 family transposase